MLTQEQKEKYIEEGGLRCPFCGDGDIEGGMFVSDFGIAEQRIQCLVCDEVWFDYYKLESIEEI